MCKATPIDGTILFLVFLDIVGRNDTPNEWRRDSFSNEKHTQVQS
jgi:hypothetical protein